MPKKIKYKGNNVCGLKTWIDLCLDVLVPESKQAPHEWLFLFINILTELKAFEGPHSCKHFHMDHMG